jgi:TRAP-type mannitol/chloroaromatic compound transport system substrate-binding protein
VAEEEAAKSPMFKKALQSAKDFRTKYKVWYDLGYLK